MCFRSKVQTFSQYYKSLQYNANARQKILITNDEIDYSTSTVRHITLKEFLESETL